MEARCAYVFKKGKRIGQCCGAKVHLQDLCKLHYKSAAFDCLPYPIISQILQHLVHPRNVKLLHILEATNRTFKDIITQDDIYAKCWDQMSKDLKLDIMQTHQLSTKKCLQLYGRVGCELCGKPRIKKVYHEYDVRCCTDCLHNHTISDYHLKDKYKLRNMTFLKSARQRLVNMYNPYAYRSFRTYDTTFYWKPDVDRLMLAHHMCTLDQYRDGWYDHNEQENNAKLVVLCDSMANGLSPQDVIQHSQFKIDAQCPIKDIKKYYTTAMKNIRRNEIDVFLQRFEDVSTFDINEILNTPHMIHLMRSKRKLEDADWDTIKGEMRTSEYNRHYHAFLKKFHPSQNAQCLQYVIDKRAGQARFTDEDILVVNYLSPVLTAFHGKCKYCTNSQRIFTTQGMRDHCRSVHHIDLV